MIDLAKKYPGHAAAASLSNALGNPRGTVYDSSTGRVTSRSDAKGNSISQTYGALGRVKTITDRTGKVTTNTYDAAGRLETIKDAENRVTTYGYDAKGQRTSTTLADNSARAMVYDAAGRVVEMLYPSGKSRKNFYAFSGVMDKVEYRNSAGALTGTDTFGYDEFLRRTSSNSRYDVANSMEYDDRGLMVNNTTTYAGKSYPVGYQYDDRGRLEEITYPSGRKVNYTFEERSLLDTIAWAGQEIEDRNYNELGLLTGITRAGSAVDEARSYDNLNRVTSIANTNVGTGSYSYDANGNKLSESWSGAMSSWNFTTQSGSGDGYDDEDRFVNFIQPTKNKTVSFTRSNIGNISNVNLNGTNTNRGYSNTHELSSVGNSSQSFDEDGNLTQSYSGIDLDWDEGGMLKQTIVGPGDTTGIEGTNEYGYDAEGKRVWKKITRDGSIAEHVIYIYAGPNCIAEYNSGANANSPSQEYVYAQAIDSLVMLVRNGGNQKLNVTRNQQWSVTALSNSSNGSIVERYTYDEFGKRTVLAPNGSTVRASSNYNNPYGYTSRRHDFESGLMYFRARFYDPTTGEFISQDPLEYVDGMSLYRGYFVPTGVDPTGTVCKPPKDACGPDATKAFTSFLARIAPVLRSLPNDEVGEWDGTWWLRENGNDIDFYLGTGNYISKTFPGCATGKCAGSLMFCGKCVRQTVLNNILYGIVAVAHQVPPGVATFGAGYNNWERGNGWEGAEQQNAYWIGYQIWYGLLRWPNVHHSKAAICKQFNQVSNTFTAFNSCVPCGKTAKFSDFGRVGIGGTKIPKIQ